MKALTFQGERSIRVDDVTKPQVKDPGDALVRVTVAGLCGSDLHLYHARTPIERGEILGHEFTGIVEDVGAHVTRVRPGDRVVACFFTFCGICKFCRRGWFSQCRVRATFGHGQALGGLGGGQAEYVVAPLANSTLELIPDGVSDEQALFVGDILATGFFGADRARIAVGDSVAIIGAGPVGLMAVIAAQLFGASPVYAVDMVAGRLEVARGLGAVPINAAEVKAARVLKDHHEGDGVDRSIEAVGSLDSILTAIHSTRPGGTVSVIGVPPSGDAAFPYMRLWWNDITFTGGVANVPAYMRQLLDLIRSGRIDPARVVSHRMKLDQGPEAYELFAARAATKILMTP
jgi:threonine dehydrogenase-like Zn-dependent dehydrogenase